MADKHVKRWSLHHITPTSDRGNANTDNNNRIILYFPFGPQIKSLIITIVGEDIDLLDVHCWSECKLVQSF